MWKLHIYSLLRLNFRLICAAKKHHREKKNKKTMTSAQYIARFCSFIAPHWLQCIFQNVFVQKVLGIYYTHSNRWHSTLECWCTKFTSTSAFNVYYAKKQKKIQHTRKWRKKQLLKITLASGIYIIPVLF